MSSHRRRNKASRASRIGNTVTSAERRKSKRDAMKAAALRSEKVIARARALTLDDFGGRSDALGG
jgi:hypothetical protein